MKAHFQRDSKGMSWFILSILFILAIPIILPSLFSCQVSIQGEPYGPGPGPAGFHGLEGPWSIVANNQPGKLEFYLAGGVWAGRIWFDVLQQWDDLTNISFNPRTGHLKFYRPVYGQEYYGTVSGKRIVGTFLPGGPTIVNTSWEAWRP